MSTTVSAQNPGVWRGFRRYLRRSFGAMIRSDEAKLQEERRRLVLQLLRGEAEQVTFRRDGLLWTVFVWDTGVAKYLFSQGSYHGEEITQLLGWLQGQGCTIGPDRWIIDCGANIGTTSLPMARDTGARILAIEPVPDNAKLLRINTLQNNLADQITCLEAAVAETAGEVEMVLSLSNSGGAEIKSSSAEQAFGAVTAKHRVIHVPTLPLDQLVAEQGIDADRVSLVWSDTQGAEAGVAASGGKLWASGVCLFAELWPRGLRAQGGADRFLAAVQKHFDRFLPCENLSVTDRPRPISELAPFLAAMNEADFTNALFLPPSFPRRTH